MSPTMSRQDGLVGDLVETGEVCLETIIVMLPGYPTLNHHLITVALEC